MFPLVKYFSIISFTIVQLPIIGYSLFQIYLKYKSICVNSDVLGWDADLRYITTLKMMSLLENFEIFSFLFQIIDSPTWPVLRNLVQIPVFYIFGESASVDVLITFCTFILLIIVSSHILFHLSQSHSLYPLSFFLIWSTLLLNLPILVYTFSAMLEIQGALFLLLSIFYFALYWNEVDTQKQKFHLYKLSLVSFGLFFTKYPYGYMFLFALTVLLFMIYLPNMVFFVVKFLSNRLNKIYLNPSLVLAFLLFIFLILAPETLFKGKFKGHIKYAIVILLVLDFYFYLYKNTKELIEFGLNQLIDVLKFVYLPIIAWVLIHPDRFTSSGSTIAHVQEEGRMVGEMTSKDFNYYTLYFKTLAMDSYLPSIVGIVITVLFICIFIYGLYSYYKNKKLMSYFLFVFFSMITILGLTFLTPNHQARHIYHIYPTIVMGIVLFFSSATKNYRFSFIAPVVFVILVSIPLYKQFQNNYQFMDTCFTGRNLEIYKLPRWIQEQSKEFLNKNTIAINLINPIHVNKVDSELLMSQIAYRNKVQLLTNPKPYRIDKNFQQIIIISESCPKEEIINEYLQKYSLNVTNKRTKKIDFGCIEIYDQ